LGYRVRFRHGCTDRTGREREREGEDKEAKVSCVVFPVCVRQGEFINGTDRTAQPSHCEREGEHAINQNIAGFKEHLRAVSGLRAVSDGTEMLFETRDVLGHFLREHLPPSIAKKSS
jgi:hypothetical protein